MSKLPEIPSSIYLDRKTILYLVALYTALCLIISSCAPIESNSPYSPHTPHPSATSNPYYFSTPDPNTIATLTAIEQQVQAVETQMEAVKILATIFEDSLQLATAVQKTAEYLNYPPNLQAEIAKLPQESVRNAIYIEFGNKDTGQFASGSGGVIASSEIAGHPDLKIIHIITNIHVAQEFLSGIYSEFSLEQPHLPGGFNMNNLNSKNTIATLSNVNKEADFALISTIVPMGVPFDQVNWVSNTVPPLPGTTYSGLGFTSTIENNQFKPLVFPFNWTHSSSPVPFDSTSCLVFQNPPPHINIPGQSGTPLFALNPETKQNQVIGLVTTYSPVCYEIPEDPNCQTSIGITKIPRDFSDMIASANQHLIGQLP